MSATNDVMQTVRDTVAGAQVSSLFGDTLETKKERNDRLEAALSRIEKKRVFLVPSLGDWNCRSNAPLFPAHLPWMHRARRRGCPAKEKGLGLAFSRSQRRSTLVINKEVERERESAPCCSPDEAKETLSS